MSFIRVSHKSEIPEGQGIAVDAGSVRVALFNVGGTIYAINNSCVHRGGPLSEGYLEDKTVTCPWHAWRFNMATGESEIDPAVRVATYQVKIQGDDVLVDV